MDELISLAFLASVTALIAAVVLAVRAMQTSRREQAAPFRGYFTTGNRREQLRQGSMSEAEDWRAACECRFTPFRMRDPRTRAGN